MQPASVDAEDEPGRVEGYDPDFTIFARLDRRLKKNRRAAKELEQTSLGRAVLPYARKLLSEFWDEQCAAAIYREYVGEARWLLKRRGTWAAWFLKHGDVPADLGRGFRDVKDNLAGGIQPGRPSQERFHDMVAACALLYRAGYGHLRVPSYAPLARFLELPEFGYPLPAHRVSEIADKVVRSFAPGDGVARYPASFEVCGLVGPLLLRQNAEHSRRQIEPRAKRPIKV